VACGQSSSAGVDSDFSGTGKECCDSNSEVTMDPNRPSSLQQRLEARRNMFFQKEQQERQQQQQASSAGNSGPPSAAPVSSYARSGSGSSTVSSASSGGGQPQPPPVATVPAAPRSAHDINGGGRKFSAGGDTTVRLNAKPCSEAATSVNKDSSGAEPASSSASSKTVVKKLKQLEGYVGFANLPNQVYRKAVKRGFEFTLMVVGESGLGKSTLINSMFLTDVYSGECPGPSARLKKTVNVDTSQVLLQESGVNLSLTIVDTPGFGDAVDNSECWSPVISYVESQYEAFLDAETRVNRVAKMPDSRVHACLYFIAPSGHGLKPLDVEFMKRLHDKVNIIPVIGKADTLTPDEIAHFKKQIMNQIEQSKIRIYEFPDDIGPSCVVNGGTEKENERERRENRKMKERVPFAVVGSNTLIPDPEGGERKIRGRKYPWGTVNIENMEHCDFVPLRNMLIRTHLQDLKEVTNNVHYENFRCRKLAGVAGGNVDKIPNRNPMAQVEEERKEHQAKMAKMEREMEEVFERKVREKRQKLSDSKADLEKRHKESREKLEQQKKELEDKMAAFEQEKASWERMNGITVDEMIRLSMESLDGGKKKKGGALSGVSFRMGR